MAVALGLPAPPQAEHRSSFVLIANDIQDPEESDARENHERSQDLLQEIWRHRGVATSWRAPFVGQDAAEAERQRSDFTARIFQKLRERGIHGIRAFRVMLHNMDINSDGTLFALTFEGALSHMGIRLKHAEYEHLIRLFGSQDPDGDVVDYVKLLSYGWSNWSLHRQEVVQEAYEQLCRLNPGSALSVATIQEKFRRQALTSKHVPELADYQSEQEFFQQWCDSELDADGFVTWLDFAEYYLDVSVCFESEHEFCQYVCSSWGIDTDDWLARKVFRQFATGEDENILPAEDFLRMLNALDIQVTEEEALAWYEAIDEDDSGDVSLEEFLSSKILKVKRLFDQFSVDHSGTVDKETMIKILRSLNEELTVEDASVLYHYADLSGTGTISFCDFLANNLLKLLHIFESFEDFSKGRARTFSAPEMKAFLKKLDPRMPDYEVQQIYKAIGTDGTGSISFAEFCESHVLRAKALFDRYDVDHSRTLTQFKFRELLLGMDSTLTTPQMEAIYNLVADLNTGKVHFGGFLNPNIVKLKLLFDKYDQDRSRYLDAGEFKAMLKDLYRNASEKDVDTLQNLICPNDEGISFTMYIQRFKDLSRKYEQLQLAKRREARAKAHSKGLTCTAP